jgi:hypothetical protein
MSARRSAAWLVSALLLAAVLGACDGEASPAPRMPPHEQAGNSESGTGRGGTGGAAGLGGLGGAGGLGAGTMAVQPVRRPPAPNVDALLQGRCATATVMSQLLPSNLLIVLDRSASMACNPPPTTDSVSCEDNPVRSDPVLDTKWEITRDALERAIDKLPPETVVGLSYFSNDDSCGVHSLPSVPLSPLDPRQVSALRASLSNVTPNGATPLVGATVLAYRHLHSEALAGEIHGAKYVVLITDGEESDICSDSSRCSDAEECTRVLLEQDVPKAASPGVGIKTFVIGAPGSETSRTVLSAIAQQGGTAPDGCEVSQGNCHFDMTRQARFNTEALEEALGDIACRALSCELPVPDPGKGGSIQLAPLNVIYSPADGSQPRLIPQDARKSCDRGADGWQYSEGKEKILLCGPTCERIRADRGARLDVVLGCPVQIVQ